MVWVLANHVQTMSNHVANHVALPVPIPPHQPPRPLLGERRDLQAGEVAKTSLHDDLQLRLTGPAFRLRHTRDPVPQVFRQATGNGVLHFCIRRVSNFLDNRCLTEEGCHRVPPRGVRSFIASS